MIKQIKLAIASIGLAHLLLCEVAAQGTPARVYASCPSSRSTGFTVGTVGEISVDINGNLCTSSSGGGGGEVTQGTVPWIVGGSVASGATDAGNPVKVGGVYNTTPPTFTNGQRGDVQIGTRGAVNVTLFGADTTNAIPVNTAGNALGDAISNTPGAILGVRPYNYVFNGSTWDRLRTTTATLNAAATGFLGAATIAQLDDTSPTTVTENQFGNVRMSANRGMLVQPFASDPQNWKYAAATGGISNTTTAVTIIAAASGLRNCITGIQASSDALGAATEVAIRDGAGGTVIWRQKVQTAGWLQGYTATIMSPICGTANTLLEVVTLTATVTGGVFFNAQGYQAP